MNISYISRGTAVPTVLAGGAELGANNTIPSLTYDSVARRQQRARARLPMHLCLVDLYGILRSYVPPSLFFAPFSHSRRHQRLQSLPTLARDQHGLGLRVCCGERRSRRQEA